MGQIYLVRHGQASFGASDYDQLSELGVEQSRLLGGWLSSCGVRFTSAVTGSLRRHRQTAEACLAALPAPQKPAGDWRADPGFDEYDHEELLVRHRPEFADTAAANRSLEKNENPRRAFQEIFAQAMARWMSGAHDVEYRESWPAFRARCRAALERVVAQPGVSQNIVVFTSGGPIAGAILPGILLRHFSDRKAAEPELVAGEQFGDAPALPSRDVSA